MTELPTIETEPSEEEDFYHKYNYCFEVIGGECIEGDLQRAPHYHEHRFNLVRTAAELRPSHRYIIERWGNNYGSRFCLVAREIEIDGSLLKLGVRLNSIADIEHIIISCFNETGQNFGYYFKYYPVFETPIRWSEGSRYHYTLQ